MNIFLLGYMGSGKSTLGKRVARRLSYSFIDMDKEIEKQTGLSIPEIFKKNGEGHFRTLETEFIISLESDQENYLIACGGGAPCFNDNLEKMNNQGFTLYLDRPVKELAHRIYNSKKSRPLVDHLSENELIDFIANHLEERKPFYEKAHQTVSRKHQSTEGITGLITDYFSELASKKKKR